MNLLRDIRIDTIANQLIFANDFLQLVFDVSTGCWTGLDAPAGLRLFFFSGLNSTADIQVDGNWLVSGEVKLLHRSFQIDPGRDSVNLQWVFQLEDDMELALSYTLFTSSARIERSSSLTCLKSAEPRRLERFRFQVPGLYIGNPGDCTFDAPGPFPFYENGKIVPCFNNTPLSQLAGQDVTVSSAPDWGFGLLSLNNSRFQSCVTAWMDTGGDPVNYRAGFRSDGRSIDFRFDEGRACRLITGQTVASARQVLWFTPTVDMAYAQYRRTTAVNMPLAANPPAWVQDAVILEVFPKYFPGGFTELTGRLPFYRDLGINTLYLMPHWQGMYAPVDFYAVDPAYGSPAELRNLVQVAHRLGMRVLFDMVIHGFDPVSPIVQEHPEFFCRTEEGQIALHPEWKSATLDWASPAYRAYMAALARYHAIEYGIDGYRVDAASFKGPNWDPALPYPAYLSGAASLQLLREMLAALRTVNKDAVLLNEVFGPYYYSVCDLSHDNMTMGPQIFLEKLSRGEVTALDYKRHIQTVFDLLPPGARRVFFARNHDTSWFYHFNGYTPAFLALDAIHIFLTNPEIFAGDPENGPNLDDNAAVVNFYRQLLTRRRDWPELSHGETILREASCDTPHVFTAMRRLGQQVTLVAISFSPIPLHASVKLTLAGLPAGLEIIDALSAQPVPCSFESGHVKLFLSPYQVLLGRFYNL